MDGAFAKAEQFLLGSARLLERRLFATCFLHAPPAGVLEAVAAYRNDDGGFGQALEPDLRCPASLPIFVESALDAVLAAGAGEESMLLGMCEFLSAASPAGAHGAVPPTSPVIEAFPRAAHWTTSSYEPGINPTAGLVGRLLALGVRHRWLERAAVWCWERLESGEAVGDAHGLLEALVFLEHVPERDRAEAVAARLAAGFAEVPLLQLDPAAPGYGLTPLQLAPQATSHWRKLFPADLIEAHLDALAGRQCGDGGWPITWEPPEGAAALEWRGIVTLQALRTLVSYGRIAAQS
ncbi:MAG TPA: hypothetical protein VMD59_21250 [Acidimicrobiales bacterium]|nr:hypothetical protein [Acidimicrobiales bacterium]